jgi:hypothetical protein
LQCLLKGKPVLGTTVRSAVVAQAVMFGSPILGLEPKFGSLGLTHKSSEEQDLKCQVLEVAARRPLLYVTKEGTAVIGGAGQIRQNQIISP